MKTATAEIAIRADAASCEIISRYFASRALFGDIRLRCNDSGHAGEDISVAAHGSEKRFKTPVRMGEILDFITRALARKAPSTIRLGNRTLDLSGGILGEGDHAVKLTEKEAALLAFLHENRGRSVGRTELLSAIWAYVEGVETHTLETHIYRLRQKIEKDPSQPEIILTDEDGAYYLS